MPSLKFILSIECISKTIFSFPDSFICHYFVFPFFLFVLYYLFFNSSLYLLSSINTLILKSFSNCSVIFISFGMNSTPVFSSNIHMQNFVGHVLFEWEILFFPPFSSPPWPFLSYVPFYCVLYWSLRQPGLMVTVGGSCPGCHAGYCRASPVIGQLGPGIVWETISVFSCFPRNADSYKPLPQGAVGHS